MKGRIGATILIVLVAITFTGCQLVWLLGLGTPELVLVRDGESTETPAGGTYDLGSFVARTDPGTITFLIMNVGSGMWPHERAQGTTTTEIVLESSETNWMGEPYGMIDGNVTIIQAGILPHDAERSERLGVKLRLGWDRYTPTALDIVPAGTHRFDVVLRQNGQEAFRATISYTVGTQTWGYLGMFVENTPELAGGSVSLGTGTLMDSIVYSTIPEAYYPQDMNSDLATNANSLFLLSGFDPAQLAEGDYTVILWMDDNHSYDLDVGESTYYSRVTIAGGDAFLRVLAGDLVPSVTEAVTVSAPGADGTLICLWLVPGGDLRAGWTFQWEAPLVGIPLGSVVSFGIGSVVGGHGATTMGNAPIAPGTYDLYAFVDTDYDFSAVSFSPLAEPGEYAARVNGVVVTGAGTTLQVSDFSVTGVDNNPYTISYDANGATGGTVPVDGVEHHAGDQVTVLDNTGNLVRTGHTFSGWNPSADGSGTTYAPGQSYTMGSADVTFYAVWTVTGAQTPVSTNVNSPSVLLLDTLTSYSIANNTSGYIDFPITSWTKGYGVYVTPTASLSLETGYFSSGWVSNAVGSVSSTGNEKRQGFKAGSANYGAEISNYSGGAASFDVVVREGILGGNYLATPIPVSLNTPTWIAATAFSGSGYNDFSFVAGDTTATVQFDTLTAGVDVEVFLSDKTTSVLPPTGGSETQVTKTVNVTGLSSLVTYVLRVSSYVFGTNGASVGQLTITSP